MIKEVKERIEEIIASDDSSEGVGCFENECSDNFGGDDNKPVRNQNGVEESNGAPVDGGSGGSTKKNLPDLTPEELEKMSAEDQIAYAIRQSAPEQMMDEVQSSSGNILAESSGQEDNCWLGFFSAPYQLKARR